MILMSEQATFQAEDDVNNIDSWLAELRSLGICVKISKKRNNGLNDSKELQYLADYIKKTLYQEYKTAYNEA